MVRIRTIVRCLRRTIGRPEESATDNLAAGIPVWYFNVLLFFNCSAIIQKIIFTIKIVRKLLCFFVMLFLWHYLITIHCVFKDLRIVQIKTHLYIDCNVQVIPQLIARIDTRRHHVARLITNQLQDIGKVHPQVWAFFVAFSFDFSC